MRLPRLLFTVMLALLLAPFAARAVEIPAYTPNVVDPAGLLSAQDTQRINDALLQLRNQQHIWGAVYLVPSLQGDSIEYVADAAFKQWQLGKRGADNGLLLVLAIEDRRSRFEVGYGLEGTLPDLVAKRALDDALAPKMRQGDTAGAVIDAFDFMGRVAAKDPATLKLLEKQTQASSSDQDLYWPRAFTAYGGLLMLIWITPVIRRRFMRRHRARLEAAHPDLIGQSEEVVKAGSGRWFTGALFLQIFATLNPGVFVFILSGLWLPVFLGCIAVEALIFWIALQTSGRRYRDIKTFRAFLKQRHRERESLMRRGHVRKSETGDYVYTPAYYASQSSSSSSSSGGGSGGSSSSGGGSSGGGGASSSW